MAAVNRCAVLVIVVGIFAACGGADEIRSKAPVVWKLDDLSEANSLAFEVVGTPQVIDSPVGRATLFDGDGDALFVDVNPLEDTSEFTIEVVFRPDPDGAPEQRFIHMQETGSKDRALLETRLPGDGSWFLDTYVKTGGDGHTLFARDFRHPLGAWYHAALVVDRREMRHYVDGELELSRPIDFRPQGPGRTSIGVRINRVDWFRGAVRWLRITPRALKPADFDLSGVEPLVTESSLLLF